MPLLRMEHYLVLSDDIQETKDFYRTCSACARGSGPKLEFPGYWLYLGDTPCIHIAEWQTYAVWTQEGRHPDLHERATARGPSTTSRSTHAVSPRCARGSSSAALPSARICSTTSACRQLFLHDPNGVAIEINFRDPSFSRAASISIGGLK